MPSFIFLQFHSDRESIKDRQTRESVSEQEQCDVSRRLILVAITVTLLCIDHSSHSILSVSS